MRLGSRNACFCSGLSPRTDRHRSHCTCGTAPAHRPALCQRDAVAGFSVSCIFTSPNLLLNISPRPTLRCGHVPSFRSVYSPNIIDVSGRGFGNCSRGHLGGTVAMPATTGRWSWRFNQAGQVRLLYPLVLPPVCLTRSCRQALFPHNNVYVLLLRPSPHVQM
jgi:hypothetical protein